MWFTAESAPLRIAVLFPIKLCPPEHPNVLSTTLYPSKPQYLVLRRVLFSPESLFAPSNKMSVFATLCPHCNMTLSAHGVSSQDCLRFTLPNRNLVKRVDNTGKKKLSHPQPKCSSDTKHKGLFTTRVQTIFLNHNDFMQFDALKSYSSHCSTNCLYILFYSNEYQASQKYIEGKTFFFLCNIESQLNGSKTNIKLYLEHVLCNSQPRLILAGKKKNIS